LILGSRPEIVFAEAYPVKLMALRPSASFVRPSSPAVGRLPDDPYYKLARHAALTSGQQQAARTRRTIATASEAASRAALPGALGDASAVTQFLSRAGKFQSVLDYLNKSTASGSRSVVASSPVSAATYLGLRPTTAPYEQMSPAPAPLPEPMNRSSGVTPLPPAEHSPPVAPARVQGDSLVVSDQADSEAWLQLVAPAAKVEFKIAKDRIQEAADAIGTEQAGLLAQGLGSLRRGLSKLADRLNPPAAGKVMNSFGDEFEAHNRAYINRFHLALDEAPMRGGRRRLEKAELEDFHRRFSRLNSCLADNVHGDGAFDECKTLYLDAWRVVRTCRVYLSA
jgi:hypothetical protein